ncbi:hypothetical protein [Halomicrobium urmianum]|uniref:hypothetical protein n=1 Tax=Halomicrobium urmianum TaxID=1586233 RepID=UPI001CD93738|nr:hypothetical protein [Halomicrobium urmianum]
MDRQDAAGLLAALGIFLLAFGVGGSVPLDTPVFGELLGLSEALSFRLAGVGVVLLISVSVVGSLLKRLTDSDR